MPPVFTPINDDQTVNYSAIPGYVKYLADSGIKSVLVGGTTSENMSLNVEERQKLVNVWVKEGKALGLHIQVQVGGGPLRDVLTLAQYSQSAGADSLLTLPEIYFKPQNVDELVSYVELVARAAPKLPVLYYHIPSMTKVEINMPAFVKAATARIPNFKGLKFTSNDLSEGAQTLNALNADQEIFLGADTLLAPAALLGIKSSIGTSFSIFPKLAQDILNAVEKGDVAKAKKLQNVLSSAIDAHTAEGAWVPTMKAGMEIVTGIKVGPPSLPQRPISPEARQRIANKLRLLKLIKYLSGVVEVLTKSITMVELKDRGFIPPVFTPLNEDRTINYSLIPQYAKYLVNNGVKNALVGGTTGEHMALSVADRKKIVDTWVKEGNKVGLRISAQVGGAPAADVLELASYFEKSGVTFLLLLTELYFKPTTVEELVSYVEMVAKAAPSLPILYYHIPKNTNLPFKMPEFIKAATARIPNFKGIKFTSYDLMEGAQALRAARPDQEVFLGPDSLIAPAALLGITSNIGTAFNLFPQLEHELLAAVLKNDLLKARALQEKLSVAIEAHACEGNWVPVMKAGMEIVTGMKFGPPALPQKPISAEARQRITTKLRGLGLIR
ncbi:uncharacterized protein ACR2FA_005389 [Aphomia sociella]